MDMYQVAGAALLGALVGTVCTRIVDAVRPQWRPRHAAALSAVVTAAIWARFGPEYAVLVGVGWWCALASAVDLGSRRLPDALTAAGAVASGTGSAVLGHGGSWLLGAVSLFGAYLLVHLAAPRSFGAGDVKLAWSLGGVAAVAGMDAWMASALLAPVITACVGLVFLARGRPTVRIPHGPSMCGSTLLALAACLS